ncbi:hypothetical protein [Cellulomonas fengjieae]|uniref:LGFP repeat-containing protein n=1 Tax=Cellulomonas fengjieae TaxID=2819978 RepID=A0ABS3SDK0_9CELL|nr:hypothetical protein [Cellulomonas fengjieae]MBO3083829.1 hypothetical protein [Cellulomonas fengjieae]QVI64884.1 hypothetical protein KG102_12045 [Cellulomonas fengjieae]
MRGPVLRAAARVVTVALLAVGSITVALGGPLAAPATAADLSGFRPGNIISDAVFFDGEWWGEGAVQSFLDTKGAGCGVGADGSACLKNYRQSTWTRPADDRCRGQYDGVGNERASAIIAKVARACGINAQAILVILQKEQGLVTTTGAAATAARYQKAMGFGCPDTAPCDEKYYGFFNQVYQAAWQFKNYALNPSRYAHRAGLTNNVRFHPNAACGTSPVLIENQATAGLYNYTPYQPNAAALAAGYGTGDACSSYGNRNFWNYFTDWFGPTHGYGVSPQVNALWSSLGGSRGALGVPTSHQRCDLVPTGCSQEFTGATVYWSPGGGAQAVGGSIRDKWMSAGGLSAGIGYPTTTVLACDNAAGCVQQFEGGAITWSAATGPQLVGGLIFARWMAAGGIAAGIGYPTNTVLGCDGVAGCTQTFQAGLVTWSAATGAQLIGGAIRATWDAHGGATGPLGYPTTTTLSCDPSAGCMQQFTGGAITWSGATGAQPVTGAIAGSWLFLGGPSAGIGLPVEAPSTCTPQACLQKFQYGAMTWTAASGSALIGGLLYAKWSAEGGLAAGLGFPTGSVQACDPNLGCVQPFENGAATWSAAAGAQLMGGLLYARWVQAGGLKAGLGLPTGTVLACPNSGCVQPLQNGAAVWSQATGPQLIGGLIHARWTELGGMASPLGLPTSTVLGCDPVAGCTQTFQRGTISWSGATGVLVR